VAAARAAHHKGKTLYFSHGFSVVYKEDTEVVPRTTSTSSSSAPRAPAALVRTLFKEAVVSTRPSLCGRTSLQGEGEGHRACVAIGSGYMYETTFERRSTPTCTVSAVVVIVFDVMIRPAPDLVFFSFLGLPRIRSHTKLMGVFVSTI